MIEKNDDKDSSNENGVSSPSQRKTTFQKKKALLQKLENSKTCIFSDLRSFGHEWSR